ncbi:MAG TPA: BTAD domain-containing putative transcriptional regulator [Gemmatimonadaceae bacterium]|nr:BTAD domain-containing putative transcriptional regulator [Gemmatimonadaceae bacterium]
MIRLHVLGALRIEGDGATDPAELLAQPKAVALLAYLALARPHGFHQRDRIVGLFWPEFDQEHARAALRKLLHRLRQTIGDDLIDARGTESISVRQTSFWCDALAFERAIEADRLREALDYFRGDLMPGFFIPGAGEFDHWLDEERAYYRERAVNVAWELVERYAADSQLTNASQLARVVARLAPTDERMLRRVMTMVWRLGDRAGAMDVYTRFAERLWRDLETRPSPETTRLVEQIQSGRPAS